MSRTDDEISQKLEAVLRPHLRFLEGNAPLVPDQPLGDLGLDSMAAVNLLLDLEQAFDVQIPDDLLSAETFETFASVEATFRPLLEHTNGKRP
jgi:acyl carrier protein